MANYRVERKMSTDKPAASGAHARAAPSLGLELLLFHSWSTQSAVSDPPLEPSVIATSLGLLRFQPGSPPPLRRGRLFWRLLRIIRCQHSLWIGPQHHPIWNRLLRWHFRNRPALGSMTAWNGCVGGLRTPVLLIA